MQSQNRLVILIIFVVLSLFSGFVTFEFIQQANTKKVSAANDGGTSAQPEVAGVNPAVPSEIGFTKLLDQGITAQDLTTFQSGITNFFVSHTDTYPASSIITMIDASCGIPDDQGFVTCTYALTVNSAIKMTGTIKTNTSGPVTITLSQDGKEIEHTTTQPLSS